MKQQTDRLIDQFLKEVSSYNTRRAYRVSLNQYINSIADTFRDTDPVDGDYRDIRTAVKAFIWESDWSETTQRAKLAAVTRFYGWLVDEKYREDNPAVKIRVSNSDAPRENRYPSTDLADRLIAGLRWQLETLKDARDISIVLILRESGLRVSELVRLKVGDLKAEGGIRVANGKRSISRRSAVTPEAAAVIYDYANRFSLDDTDWLFPGNSEGGRLSTRGIWEILRAGCRRAGLSAEETELCQSPHNWRHLWVTEHISAGTPLALIQIMGGWSTSRMVMQYADKINLIPVAVRR